MVHTLIYNSTIGSDVTACWVSLSGMLHQLLTLKPPDKRTSHDAHLTNKFGNERNDFEYSCEAVFQWQHIRFINTDCGHAIFLNYLTPSTTVSWPLLWYTRTLIYFTICTDQRPHDTLSIRKYNSTYVLNQIPDKCNLQKKSYLLPPNRYLRLS
jgi:hypothetical protein